MATIEELQAEVQNLTSERDNLRSELQDANGQGKGHRLNANKLKGQLEALQAEHDTALNKLEMVDTQHAAALDRLKIDLTAQLNAKQAELDQRTHADRDKRTSEMLTEAATKLGLVDPDGFLKVLDRTDLKVGDDGTVENADEVVAKFKSEKPYFFGAVRGATTIDPRSTSSLRVAPRVNQPSVPDARKMTPDEVKELRRQITSGSYTTQ